MFATPETIQDLRDLQQYLLTVGQTQRKLDELPQRQEILRLRQKKAQIEEKARQVDALLSKAKQDLSRISDDDERMGSRQVEKQNEIENASASGNFRAVGNLSKELDTIAKKRAALSDKSDACMAQLEKVNQVKKQVDAALASVNAAEEKEIASFRQQGGALQKEIAHQNACIEQISARIPDQVLAEFKKIAARSGGVALGEYADGRCGCCRASIDSAHLAHLRSQAPLATCPSCKRLLVIS